MSELSAGLPRGVEAVTGSPDAPICVACGGPVDARLAEIQIVIEECEGEAVTATPLGADLLLRFAGRLRAILAPSNGGEAER